jgi:segregation and condensation protein B
MHAQSTEPNDTAELIPLEVEPAQSARETLLVGLKPILEAAILASHQPLSIEQMSELFDEAVRPTHNELAQCLEALSADCDSRGVELIEVASGFRFQVKASVYQHVGRLWTERQSKYSRALLETLSLIAYRQPITRPEIEGVRGVAVSSQIIRTLEEREWIRVVGHREVPGRPALFGTTRTFLDYFKLKSLEDLPTLSEIKDLDDMAPELDFSGTNNTPVNVALPSDEAEGANALESTETNQIETNTNDAESATADESDHAQANDSQANDVDVTPEANIEHQSEEAELDQASNEANTLNTATGNALELPETTVDANDDNHDEALP